MPENALRQGSPVKRAAIVRAALEVFLREGYARASVDAIAAAAGVSKRTVYDYYGDKERLFLSTIEEISAQQNAAFDDLLERTLGGEIDDIEAALTSFGREFGRAIARSPERSAVLRLMIAEASHFPALLSATPEKRAVQSALADRLTQLAERGGLDIPDPAEAAEFLGILVTGRVNNRSWYGTRPMADDEIDRLVTDGVQLFLRAYRTKGRG
jgi:AcrR family transcriptional regulator